MKHMYCSLTKSQLQQWHVNNKSINGIVCHIANDKAWAHIDGAWPDFGNESENLR
jgi:hypothetical protein